MRIGKFGVLMIAGIMLLTMASSGGAVVLTVSGPVSGNTLGPQSTSNPCIIAATQCQQPAGFGFNNFTSSGAIDAFNMFSTTPTANVANGVQGTPYTGAQLNAVTNNQSFVVAVDVNTTNAAGEVLTLFQVIVNGVVRDQFSGSVNIGQVGNNGNGFGDYSIGTIAPFAATDQVLFHAVWSNASDGGESFFIIGAPTPVPEPGALLLVGTGLVGLAAFARKKLHR